MTHATTRLALGALLSLTTGMASALAEDPPEGDGAHETTPVYADDFEGESSLAGHRLLELAPGEGVNGSTGLRATYVGEERGSSRIVRREALSEALNEATLVYDVRFEEDFQFVRGGKLHGLGPARTITGGNPIEPWGWSARVVFGSEGTIRTYLYNQDQSGTWGSSRTASDFRFETGEFYAISLHVKINDPDEANGFAHIYVDGDRVLEHNDVRFRGEEGDHTLINQFLFSTFHGGSSPAWAPTHEDGSYATVHATFDNFAVFPGKSVRSEPGS